MAKDNRGLAKLKEEGREDEIRQIASKGGHAAHIKGTAHEFTSDEAREAGRKGGQAVKSKYGREFYEEIGRKGALARNENDE